MPDRSLEDPYSSLRQFVLSFALMFINCRPREKNSLSIMLLCRYFHASFSFFQTLRE